ncbi:uncharacterized protein VICG_01213 [Vittaforma corneae ATCC 50505]|uniref:U2A'/phosphoprotein 32 family A C-terminal domain-containing protein n=1 Tax=Vittaforma corneae (strain ATCC 50505) TaxID=993615 RepID=L2GM57_VITCO|nr:uncharacterized protein VICG_01213 [Vittaforma corneae ATCC 50505]ELA41709.1 hypothetical protein VICG_01213 [Vittaforma corneae ATCC 50505]
MNSSDLSKITTLLLTGVGLTEIPCLSELTGLEYMCLDNNRIEHISLQNYFDDKTRKYKPMIGLRHLDLYGNPISKVNISITKVFTNKSILISMDKTRLRYPFSNMKKKLDKVDIELIEKDLESENESDVKS